LLEGCDASIVLDYRAVTTPFGIALGIGFSSAYDENSPTTLIVGVFNATSSGILIYMALVDLLAADFINSSQMRKNGMLQLCSYVALLLGIGAMSLIAKWA
jgi:zinc transporter 1/2/3